MFLQIKSKLTAAICGAGLRNRKHKRFAHEDERREPPSNGRKTIRLSKIFGIAAYHASLKNDFEKAIFWAEMGASENDKFSFAYLGSAYYTGRGVGQDFKMAVDYLKRAGPEPLALKLLSDAYEKGNGVDKDLKKSKLYSDYADLLIEKKNSKIK